MDAAEAIVGLVREGASGAPARLIAQRSAAIVAEASEAACVIAVKGGNDDLVQPLGLHHPAPALNRRLAEMLAVPFEPTGGIRHAYVAGQPVLDRAACAESLRESGSRFAALAEEFALKGLLAVPLTGRLGRIGVLVLAAFGSEPPDESDLSFALDASSVLALAIELDLLTSTRRARRPDSDEAPRATRGLSDRECQILALLARGHTNREAADQLFLSVRTVEWYRARIQTKLGTHGRAELVEAARRLGV